jgi:hypothetical protein
MMAWHEKAGGSHLGSRPASNNSILITSMKSSSQSADRLQLHSVMVSLKQTILYLHAKHVKNSGLQKLPILHTALMAPKSLEMVQAVTTN